MSGNKVQSLKFSDSGPVVEIMLVGTPHTHFME